jgi:hypothetical protein
MQINGNVIKLMFIFVHNYHHLYVEIFLHASENKI